MQMKVKYVGCNSDDVSWKTVFCKLSPYIRGTICLFFLQSRFIHFFYGASLTVKTVFPIKVSAHLYRYLCDVCHFTELWLTQQGLSVHLTSHRKQPDTVWLSRHVMLQRHDCWEHEWDDAQDIISSFSQKLHNLNSSKKTPCFAVHF